MWSRGKVDKSNVQTNSAESNAQQLLEATRIRFVQRINGND